MNRRLVFVFGLLLVLPGHAVFADDPHICAPAIDGKISALGLKSGDITERLMYNENTADGEGVTVGYYAWMRVKSCKTGWLVMNMHKDCDLIQTYTDGPCRIPGVNPG